MWCLAHGGSPAPKGGARGHSRPDGDGLLVLGINSSTRLLTYVVGLDKEYLATIRLGSSTTTDDREGEETGRASAASVAAISREAIDRIVRGLTGEISQVPSTVSAIKVDGKRAYALARAGEQVELASRAVTVSEFAVLDSREVDGYLDLDVRVQCSSGTYIRALARDLGFALGVGGHLTALRRTRIGPFAVTDAAQLDDLVVADPIARPGFRRHHAVRHARSRRRPGDRPHARQAADASGVGGRLAGRRDRPGRTPHRPARNRGRPR